MLAMLWVISTLRWEFQGPQACDSGSLRVGEMDLRGGVVVGMNQICLNMSLTIQIHAMKKAAELRAFRVVSRLRWGPRRPQMYESRSSGIGEIDL